MKAGGIPYEAWIRLTERNPQLRELHPNHAGNAPAVPSKRSKYRNTWTVYNGVKYQSKSEANHAERLDFQIRVGLIQSYERQVTFRLGEDHKYRTDFVVVMPDGSKVAHDPKGVETPEFRRTKRLWRKYGTMPLHVIKGGKTIEIITPDRKD